MTNYAEALACGYEDSVYPTESFYSVCLPCLQISISSLVVVGMHHMEVVVVVAHLGIRIPVVGQDTLGKAAVGTLVVSKGCIPVRSVKVFNEILFNLDKYFYSCLLLLWLLRVRVSGCEPLLGLSHVRLLLHRRRGLLRVGGRRRRELLLLLGARADLPHAAAAALQGTHSHIGVIVNADGATAPRSPLSHFNLTSTTFRDLGQTLQFPIQG